MTIRRWTLAGIALLAAVAATQGIAGNPLDDIKREVEKIKKQQHPPTPKPGQPQAATPAGQPLQAQVKEDLMGPATGRMSMSEDGSHLAMVVPKGSRQVVLLDGVEGPVFDEIPMQFIGANSPVVWSPTGGHSAYVGRRGGDYIAVLDGKESGTIATSEAMKNGSYGFTPEWKFLFSQDGSHLAYSISDGGKWGMLLDGAKQPGFKTIDMRQFVLAGKRLAYVGTDDNQTWHVVVDGKSSPAYSSVTSLKLNPDGTHYAYLASGVGQVYFAVHDGVEGKHYNYYGLQDLEMAPDGRIAYSAVWGKPQGGHDIGAGGIVVDGTEIPNVTSFGMPTPAGGAPQVHVAWSPDGKRYAYIQQNTPDPGVTVKVNGKPMGLSYAGAGQLLWSPDGTHLAYMANAPNQLCFPVVDGKELDACHTYTDFKFSPNSQHYAYIARTQEGLKLYYDGKETWKAYSFDGSGLGFSPDGSHLGYSATTSISVFGGFVDGKPLDGKLSSFRNRMNTQPAIFYPKILFSPDGKRTAYVADKADGSIKTSIVVDGTWYPGAASLFAFPAFSSDSKHWAVMDGMPNGWMLMADGKVSPMYENVLELNPNAARFVDAHSYRFYGIKGGQVYKVTVGLS